MSFDLQAARIVRTVGQYSAPQVWNRRTQEWDLDLDAFNHPYATVQSAARVMHQMEGAEGNNYHAMTQGHMRQLWPHRF